MEQKLIDQNETVASALEELQNLYEEINKDLGEAEKLQQSLVPVRHREIPSGEVSVLFQSRHRHEILRRWWATDWAYA
jgi:sigma-B regulation protein RsbU (phosphoserine phosphatase)